MADHVKPTLQEANLDHIILQTGTNNLSTLKMASKIVKNYNLCTDIFENNGSTVTVLHIVTIIDKLNDKTNPC